MPRLRSADTSAHLLVRRVLFQMDLILHQLEGATVLLTVGTSGVVEPAASFGEDGPSQSCANDLCWARRAVKQWVFRRSAAG